MGWLKEIPGFVIGGVVLVAAIIVVVVVYNNNMNQEIERRKALGVAPQTQEDERR